MLRHFRARLVAVATTASFLACNAEPSFGPGSRSDLSEVLNELSIVKNSIAMEWSRPIRLTEPTVFPANCTYTASAQSFTCPAQTLLGVTVTQSYTLLSARGDPQSAFDIDRTAAVRLRTVLVGRTSVSSSDLAVDGQETLTLSGLLSGTHTVDGSSTLHLNGLLTAPNPLGGGTSTKQINTSITTTVSQLVLQTFPSSIEGYSYTLPTRGTIRVENGTSVAGQPPSVSSAVFPYDGTDHVVVVVTRDGVSHTCDVSLVGISYVVCL